MKIEDQIPAWSDEKFLGCTRDELREAGKALGCKFGPNTSDDVMRTKLCETVGVKPAETSVQKAQPVPPRKNGIFDPKPLLTPESIRSKQWGGKMHRVLVFPQSNDTENPKHYVQLTWEGIAMVYPYNKELTLPHPLYIALKNAKRNPLIEKKIKDEDGVIVGYSYFDNKTPRYPHDYRGVVPGTENLPESLLEYWKTQAKKHSNFVGVPRRTLQMIRAELFTPMGPAFYKDLTDDDILADIHQALGIDEFSQVA